MAPRFPASALLLALALVSCETFDRSRRYPPPPPPSSGPDQPLTPDPSADEYPLPVKKVPDPIVVAAWAEPKALPPGGGQVQILVRIQKKGGRRYPDVEVRLRASTGALYSEGRVLVTDSQGMTRDRLTAREATTITMNAGGTRYRFRVPVAEAPPGPDD